MNKETKIQRDSPPSAEVAATGLVALNFDILYSRSWSK